MGKLRNALEGRKSQAGLSKKKGELQLDLFMSLSDRSGGGAERPPVDIKAPDPKERTRRPEPELVLPVSSRPPDVAADVRAALSDGDAPRTRAAGSPAAQEPGLPPTGIYRRPVRRRPEAPPSAGPAPPPSRLPMWTWIRDWFQGVELDRRILAGVGVLLVLVAILAFWTACPRGSPPGTVVDLREIHRDLEQARQADEPPVAVAPAAAVPGPTPSPAAPPTAGPAPALNPADWKIAGAEVSAIEGGLSIRFAAPVFASADLISPEGMNGLRAVARKLVEMKSGARVIVTGHTDDVPISRPTPQFGSNADLAAARAKAAREHLEHYARANRNLAFEERAGAEKDAPYPNDSPRNRRLNRTATIRVLRPGS